MSSLPPMTSRQLSELRDSAQNNLVSQLCDTLMDSTSTIKDKIKEPLADTILQIMQNPENMSRLADSVHGAIHKSLENSLKGPLLLYSLTISETGFEEVKKHITSLFTQAYGEKATMRSFRGKLYAILQHSQSLQIQKGGNKKTHHKRHKGTTRTRKHRYTRGGSSKAIPIDGAVLQEKIQEGVMDIATQQVANANDEKQDNAETPDVAQQSEGTVNVASSEHDLREYNNALLDEMKKNVQEVGEQMTSKMIDAIYVSVKSNADIIVRHIVSSVGKSIEKDEMFKSAGPVIILQALRASSTDVDKALISTFDETRAKDPEAVFVPIQSSFINTYMKHLKLRLTKQVTGK